MTKYINHLSPKENLTIITRFGDYIITIYPRLPNCQDLKGLISGFCAKLELELPFAPSLSLTDLTGTVGSSITVGLFVLVNFARFLLLVHVEQYQTNLGSLMSSLIIGS